ncbi:helix-turn-helix domain-containing protein [Halosegnis marinus]|uniref:Helix-turn-helix domain-containing protein n=2 Tax=Halosegnis marinus TaxID=3034023 RepID=A0ABD5ZN94_9EURY|nr:helix-turn-helix domain-containing protein [Halosegnis sp. DT85]
MPRANLAVSLGDEWAGRLSRRHPDAEFDLVAADPNGTDGYQLVRVRATDPDPAVAAMRDARGFRSLSVVREGDTAALVRFRAAYPLVLFALSREGIPFEPPLRCRDGTGSLSVTAPDPALSALSDRLGEYGVRYRLESLSAEPTVDAPLTQRQRDVLLTAVEMGYYDTPRDCTLTAVADAVGTAKSSASETLHRAEGAVVRRFAAAAEAEPSDNGG